MSEKNDIEVYYGSRLPHEIYDQVKEFHPSPESLFPPNYLPNAQVAIWRGEVIAVVFVCLMANVPIAQISSIVVDPMTPFKIKHKAVCGLVEQAEIFAKANGMEILQCFCDRASLIEGLKDRFGFVEEITPAVQLNKKL